MPMIILEDPKRRIATLAEPGEQWLCCSSCDRFFQLKAGQHGDEVYCPFPDCSASGLGFAIFLWNARREPKDSRWPKSPDELSHGLRERIDALIGPFESSPEHAEIGAEPSCYLLPFLQMMSDLCSDLTVESHCGFSNELGYFVEDLPVWSKTAVPAAAERMQKVLVAFFRFAARTQTVQNAQQWLQFLVSIELVELLQTTMLRDPRLQKKRRGAN